MGGGRRKGQEEVVTIYLTINKEKYFVFVSAGIFGMTFSRILIVQLWKDESKFQEIALIFLPLILITSRFLFFFVEVTATLLHGSIVPCTNIIREVFIFDPPRTLLV